MAVSLRSPHPVRLLCTAPQESWLCICTHLILCGCCVPRYRAIGQVAVKRHRSDGKVAVLHALALSCAAAMWSATGDMAVWLYPCAPLLLYGCCVPRHMKDGREAESMC